MKKLRSDEEIAFRLFLYWFSLIYMYWCINICITTFFFQDLQYQSEGIDKPSTDKMVYILIAVIALMVVVLGIFTFLYIRNTQRYVKSLIKEMFLTIKYKHLSLKLILKLFFQKQLYSNRNYHLNKAIDRESHKILS